MVQIAKDVRFFSMSMLFCLLVYYIMCPDPWHILVMFTSPNSQNWSLYRGTETRAASRAMNIEMWAFLVRFKIDSTQHGYAVQVQSLDVSHVLHTAFLSHEAHIWENLFVTKNAERSTFPLRWQNPYPSLQCHHSSMKWPIVYMAGDVIGQIVYIYSKDNVEQIIPPCLTLTHSKCYATQQLVALIWSRLLR